MVDRRFCALGTGYAFCYLSWNFSIKLLFIAPIVLSPSFGRAQLPVTELTSLSPTGAQVGSLVQVQTFGANQENGTQLLFSHSGIKAAPKQAPRNEFVPEQYEIAGQFEVTVAKDVPLGIYDVRLAGRFGVSNPRSFVVGAHAEVSDNGSNRQFATAQPIDHPTTVNGIAEASATDYYKLHLAAGERVLIDCLAQRIDSRMDASLSIFDADGRELKRNLDLNGSDPLIDFSAPAAGDFIIAVWDFLYEGGNDYFYRLNVAREAHVDFIFPPAGLAGTRMATTLFGRNLEGGFSGGRTVVDGIPLEAKLTSIDLPPSVDTLAVGVFVQPQSALIDGIPYLAPDGTSIFVGLSPVPVIVELEPNNEAAAAQAVPVPCEIAGQFFPSRDADVFQFDMHKGETYVLDVISQRMGLPTDPVMTIQRLVRDAEGKVTVATVAQVDDPQDRNRMVGSPFDTSTDDPTFRLTADADATYRVSVRDQFDDAVSDPRCVYRLAIRPLQPDFRLHAVPEELRVANPNEVRLTSLAVRRGGTVGLKVSAERLDGFKGEIALEVEGVPGGVQVPKIVIGAEQNSASLVFIAAEDASQWVGPIRIIGRADVAGRNIARNARCGAILWGTANKTLVRPEFRLARELYLAVVPEVIPAFVKPSAELVLETSIGAKFDVPLELTRRDGFAEAVKLVAQDVPAELKPADVDIPADKSAGTLVMALTNAKLKPGAYSFYLRSDTKVKYSRNPEAVVQAEADLQTLTQIVEQLTAKTAELKTNRESLSQQSSATAGEKTAADTAIVESEATLKRATDLKAVEEKRVAELKKSSVPADVNVALISTPIRLRIARTPLVLSLPNAQIVLQRGQKVEIEASLERKYGFNDAVELSLELPSDAAGLTTDKISLPAVQSAAKLSVAASDDVKAGTVTVTLRAKAKFNGVDVDDSSTLTLTIP